MDAEFELSFKDRDWRQLQAMLKEVQARLGTDAEQPGDLARAGALAHRLNNVIMDVRLREELLRLTRSNPSREGSDQGLRPPEAPR
jgi:hypothetical protein